MKNINICIDCLKAYEPVEIDGVRCLQVFDSFTVDLRLQQFRKANVGEELVFIEFDSYKGLELLNIMQVSLHS